MISIIIIVLLFCIMYTLPSLNAPLILPSANKLAYNSTLHAELILLYYILQIYIAEISPPKLKGLFGVGTEIFVSLGLAIPYFLGINFGGHQIGYSDIALAGVGFSILFEILMMVATVESPRWLFSKKLDESGTRVLKTLRGPMFQVNKEIDNIKTAVKQQHPIKKQLLELKHRAAYHPFILVVILLSFQQFSGINAVNFYMSEICKAAGYDRKIINLVAFGTVGFVRVPGVIVSAAIVDCFGRRTLLIASSVVTTLGHFFLGIYFLILDVLCKDSLDSPKCPNGIEYLAIVSVVVFLIGFSLGWAPLPPLSIGELLPYQVRALGGSLASMTFGISALIVTFSFPYYVALVTPKFVWWTFTIIMILSFVFVVLFLPEARGKSLEEMQDHLKKGGIIAFKCSCGPKCKTKS